MPHGVVLDGSWGKTTRAGLIFASPNHRNTQQQRNNRHISTKNILSDNYHKQRQNISYIKFENVSCGFNWVGLLLRHCVTLIFHILSPSTHFSWVSSGSPVKGQSHGQMHRLQAWKILIAAGRKRLLLRIFESVCRWSCSSVCFGIRGGGGRCCPWESAFSAASSVLPPPPGWLAVCQQQPLLFLMSRLASCISTAAFQHSTAAKIVLTTPTMTDRTSGASGCIHWRTRAASKPAEAGLPRWFLSSVICFAATSLFSLSPMSLGTGIIKRPTGVKHFLFLWGKKNKQTLASWAMPKVTKLSWQQ